MDALSVLLQNVHLFDTKYYRLNGTGNWSYSLTRKDTILFYEGDICKDILYLLEGNIKLSVSANTYDEIPLYDFCEKEQCIVNIASALSQTKAVATAITKTNIKGWLIPADVIQNLIIHYPSYQ